MTGNVGETYNTSYIGVIVSEQHSTGFLEMHSGQLKEQEEWVWYWLKMYVGCAAEFHWTELL